MSNTSCSDLLRYMLRHILFPVIQNFRCGENVGKENRKTLVECILRGFCVPGAGIEPARIAPLVFETSASTDSAIRAGVVRA